MSWFFFFVIVTIYLLSCFICGYTSYGEITNQLRKDRERVSLGMDANLTWLEVLGYIGLAVLPIFNMIGAACIIGEALNRPIVKAKK